jgi:ribonucleoside-diphosphate reductase alpha chain
MECDIHRSKVGGGDWLFFVGKLNGMPYEVFGGDSEKFTIPLKYKNGWIQKNGKVDGVSQYNIILGSLEDKNEKLEFKGITKHFNNSEYGAFTRVISLTMRHGVPIKYICEQITKKEVEGDLFSFQRAMARVLKKYIAEGEHSEIECPNCHSKEMIYKNGCPECKVCGHSNCS